MTAEGRDTITRSALESAPALRGRSPFDSWAGLRPVTPDRLPVVGPGAVQLDTSRGHNNAAKRRGTRLRVEGFLTIDIGGLQFL